MAYTTHDLKIPDDKPWIALVQVTPTGESNIIGYIEEEQFQQLSIAGGKLYYLWNSYNNL